MRGNASGERMERHPGLGANHQTTTERVCASPWTTGPSKPCGALPCDGSAVSPHVVIHSIRGRSHVAPIMDRPAQRAPGYHARILEKGETPNDNSDTRLNPQALRKRRRQARRRPVRAARARRMRTSTRGRGAVPNGGSKCETARKSPRATRRWTPAMRDLGGPSGRASPPRGGETRLARSRSETTSLRRMDMPATPPEIN